MISLERKQATQEADEFVELNKNLRHFSRQDRALIRDTFIEWYFEDAVERYFETVASAWLVYVRSLKTQDDWYAHIEAVRRRNLADYIETPVESDVSGVSPVDVASW